MRRVPLSYYLGDGFRQFYTLDLRWSYLAGAALLVIGLLVNLALPHGWVIWPFVFIAAIMMMVHEAVQRSGQGLPPLRVYLMFASGLTIWLGIVAAMVAVGPIVVLIGSTVIVYYGAQGMIKNIKRQRLIARRREEGRCIHCGEFVDPNMAFCENCGEEPDSEVMQRVAAIVRGSNRGQRARETLQPQSPTTGAKLKEQALLARRRTGKPPRS
ncbi:MAG: zinc ribbon domain-containing protein [Tepidisphaeraceae bacterium]|jgi:hypothetical protein